MSRRRYQRGKFGAWAAGDAVHVASLLVTATTRLRTLAQAKALPRIRSAEQLAAAMLLADFEPQLVAMSQIIWDQFVRRDEGDDE